MFVELSSETSLYKKDYNRLYTIADYLYYTFIYLIIISIKHTYNA